MQRRGCLRRGCSHLIFYVIFPVAAAFLAWFYFNDISRLWASVNGRAQLETVRLEIKQLKKTVMALSDDLKRITEDPKERIRGKTSSRTEDTIYGLSLFCWRMKLRCENEEKVQLVARRCERRNWSNDVLSVRDEREVQMCSLWVSKTSASMASDKWEF